jgi:antitoxin (DNA-binding transcriptional repressor) of toxin-antitoxin stability system
MATVTVGVQEFQAHLSDYLESDSPVAITQDGRRVGMFIPAPRKPAEVDFPAFAEAGEAVKAMMDEAGVTEDQIIEDFEQMKRQRRDALSTGA